MRTATTTTTALVLLLPLLGVAMNESALVSMLATAKKAVRMSVSTTGELFSRR